MQCAPKKCIFQFFGPPGLSEKHRFTTFPILLSGLDRTILFFQQVLENLGLVLKIFKSLTFKVARSSGQKKIYIRGVGENFFSRDNNFS